MAPHSPVVRRCGRQPGRGSAPAAAGSVFAWEIEQGPVLVALEEAREPVHKLVVLGGVGLRTVLDVGAHENQAAGAALAVGGGDAGLGAADLAGEGCALAALGLLERFFLRREFLFEGRLPRQ